MTVQNTDSYHRLMQARAGRVVADPEVSPFLRFLRELILPRARSGEVCAEKHKHALFTQNPLPPKEEDFVSRLVGIRAIYLNLFSL